MTRKTDPPLGQIEHVPALVPAGRYVLRVMYWSTFLMFGKQGKLALSFAIMDQGKHFGIEVVRWHNCRLKGQTGKYGRFAVGWGSDLLREYVTLVGMPNRADRIALSRYESMLLAADVETVTKTRTQEVLPPALRYSVIRKLVAVELGKAA
jgi:hypothetical protein